MPDLDDDGEWYESLEGRPDGERWTELPDFGALPSFVVPSARHGLVIACDTGVQAASEWAEQHGWPVVSETGGVGLAGGTAISAGAWLLGIEEFHQPFVALPTRLFRFSASVVEAFLSLFFTQILQLPEIHSAE